MKHKQRLILSTRPLNPSLISDAAKANIVVETDAYISTIPVSGDANDEKIKLLGKEQIVAVFTSMNAVESVVATLAGEEPDWRIFSIGNTTNELLRKHFPSAIIEGCTKNAAALADEILTDDSIRAVTFFCGDQRREELPEKLRNRKVHVEEIVVYKTISRPHRISKTYDGIMFFSPSAVESFFTGNVVEDRTILFAIGETTAKSVEQYCTNKVIIADHPGKEVLLKKVIAHFTNINQNK